MRIVTRNPRVNENHTKTITPKKAALRASACCSSALATIAHSRSMSARTWKNGDSRGAHQGPVLPSTSRTAWTYTVHFEMSISVDVYTCTCICLCILLQKHFYPYLSFAWLMYWRIIAFLPVRPRPFGRRMQGLRTFRA